MSSQLARDCSRRAALAGLAIGGAGLAACGSTAGAQAARLCGVTPTEIRGPFPADGVGGHDRAINVLDLDGVVRRDIRSAFAGLTGDAPGAPLELVLRLVSAGEACAPRPSHAIYVWMCDARGNYSLYNRPEVNWLRGLQRADAQGVARFTAIVPGCYGGRAPHLHLEVFSSLADARAGAAPLLVSQLGFPTRFCAEIYADTAVYGDSARNLERWPAERDWAFRGADRAGAMMLKMTGERATGYTASATIGLPA